MTPVFIGGAGRSGTTLVVDMLGLHPRISPIYETDFVLEVAGLLFDGGNPPGPGLGRRIRECMEEWTRPLPIQPHNKRSHERFHHGPHYIRFDRPFALQRTEELCGEVEAGRAASGFRRFVDALFLEHCRQDGKPRWVNKTPRYVRHLPLLRGLFPDLRFIHCLRDGRDVACSAVTRPWGPADHRAAATWWIDQVRPGLEFAEMFPAQTLEVQFEALVQSPVETLGRMLAWLGEESSAEEIVAHYAEGDLRLDPTRIGEWNRGFTPEERRAFHEVAGGMLERFGYQVAG